MEERQKRLQGKKEVALETDTSSPESLASVLVPVPVLISDDDTVNKALPSPLEREISSPASAISEWNNLVEISHDMAQGDISLEPGVISVQGDISTEPISAEAISAQSDINTHTEVPALIVETLESVREKMAAVTVRERQGETPPEKDTGVKVIETHVNELDKIPVESAKGGKVLETAVILEKYEDTAVNLVASQTAANMKALDTAVVLNKYQETPVNVAAGQTETIACLGQNKGQRAQVETSQLGQQETCLAVQQQTIVIEENNQTLGPEKSQSEKEEINQLVNEDTSENSEKDTFLSNIESQCIHMGENETVTIENQFGIPKTKTAVKEMVNEAAKPGPTKKSEVVKLGPTEKSEAVKFGPTEMSEPVNLTGQVTEEVPTLAKESSKTASCNYSDNKLSSKINKTPLAEADTFAALVTSVSPPSTTVLPAPTLVPKAAAKTTNPDPPPATCINDHHAVISLEEQLNNCQLPDTIDDSNFQNKLKVFNNYRNFGAMYCSKNNFKKAEWAFKNGIKQAVGGEQPRSKEQLRAVVGAEVEFRLNRAR